MSTTLAKLQAKLNSPIECIGGYMHKAPIPSIKCNDGVSISIQASEFHYCSPRNNCGPYTTVEVWCLSGADPADVTQFDYDEDGPSGYVPIESVVAFLDIHGGIID